MKADLIVFYLMEFNLILGMEWLFKHYAKIDCRKREFVFQSPNEDRFRYVGTSIRTTPPVISTLQARRSIEDGAVAFLAMVVDKSIRNKEDFSEVFANKLPRLPPDREIEFGIE